MRANRKSIYSGVALAVTLALAAGCNTTKDGRSDGRIKDDKHITSTVEKDLKEDPLYKFTDVRVDTFAGIVQLSGFVDNNDQRNRAEEIARNTSGVQGVANGLSLKPVMEPTGRTNALMRMYVTPPKDAYRPPTTDSSHADWVWPPPSTAEPNPAQQSK